MARIATPVEETMKSAMMALALFVTACPALGQQSGTTNTNCQVNGNQMNCTTQHVPTWDETFNKWRNLGKRDSDQSKAAPTAPTGGAPQLSPEAIKELLAEEKKERESKDTVDFIYCRRNPNGSMADSEGQLRTCADTIEYTKAFCSVNPEVERCTLAKSKAEVEKAFTALVNEYNAIRTEVGVGSKGFTARSSQS